jgi:protease I
MVELRHVGEGEMTDPHSPFLEVARRTGVEIVQEEDATIWLGAASGTRKPLGPMVGKTVGVLVASEFSDWQAYYMLSYLSEFGATCEFLVVDWVTWKFTRPTVRTKGVVGMWGLSVDPNPTIPAGGRYVHRSLRDANPNDYDAVVVLGGYSADVMVTEAEVITFIQKVYDRGTFVGSIGAGAIPLLAAGTLHGKRATGNKIVAYMIARVGHFTDVGVVRDGSVITARDTVDTPDFVRMLCRAFDPTYVSRRKGILAGKRIVIVAGEEFEDIEIVVPVMEYLYRGARVTLATFPPPMRTKPALLGLDVIVGSFGVTVPLQEIPESHYSLMRLADIAMDDFDHLLVPGGFCPWNMILAGDPIRFLRQAYDSGKIIGIICHSEIAAAAADILGGKKTSGWLACQTAVTIMGGDYNFDRSAVIVGNLVSGRTPNDVPEFLDACTEALLRRWV